VKCWLQLAAELTCFHPHSRTGLGRGGTDKTGRTGVRKVVGQNKNNKIIHQLLLLVNQQLGNFN